MRKLLFNAVKNPKPFKGHRLLGLSGLLLVLILAFSAGPALAQDSEQSNLTTYTSREILTVSDLERLYPMTAAAEAAIVHVIPSVPVIIDGVTFAPEQISRFNGHRLHFVIGQDETLYAFTAAAGLEKYLAENSRTQSLTSIESVVYQDWWYAGVSKTFQPGEERPFLDPLLDNSISSVQAGTGIQCVYLYDYTYYGGDSTTILGGTGTPVLALSGWNDRASSLWVQP